MYTVRLFSQAQTVVFWLDNACCNLVPVWAFVGKVVSEFESLLSLIKDIIM